MNCQRGSLAAVVWTVVVVAAVIFMIPVAFLHVPAVSFVLVVRVVPVSAFVRGPLPHTGNPDVTASVDPPIPIDPRVALGGRRRAALITNRRWCATTDNDAQTNLREGRCGEGGQDKASGEEV